MDIFETQIDIVKKFVDNNKSSICYLSATTALTEKITECLSSDFTVIDLLNDFSPFRPFLSILSQKHPSENVLKELSYSVQTESFITFFKNGFACERYDIPVENELVYETNRFIKTICQLTERLNETNYLVINSQVLQNNSLELIKELENYNLKGKFIFCFNAEATDEDTKITSDFFERNSNKRNFLYLRAKIDGPVNNLAGNYAFKEVASRYFKDFDSVFKNLRNNRIFMSNEELQMIADWTVKNMSTLKLTSRKQRELYLELALAYFTCQQYDKAILYFNDVLDSRLKDDLALASLYYLTAIFYYKKSNDFAKHYENQLKELIGSNTSSPYYTLAAMTEFQFYNSYKPEDNAENYQKIMSLLEDAGFINNYISTGLSLPWSLMNNAANKDFVFENIEKCYNLAKQIDNQHLISKACHWKGIILSHNGQQEEAMKWYEDCNRIRTQIGEIVPIMNIRNGLSYESCQRAKYEDAYNLLNDVIKHLYNLSDYTAVIDTLKNTAYALFYARHFAQADAIITKILHYLHIFNLEQRPNNSFLPSVNDMLIFKTIIELNENDYIHARINYTRIIQDPKDITSEDKPLLNLVKAALLLEDGDPDEAFQTIDESIEEFKSIKSDQSHKICFLCYEFAILLNRLGILDESDRYLEMGFTLAKEKNFVHYTKHKEELSVYDYLRDTRDFAPLNIDLLFLDEKAEKEVLLTQLHKRIHDYKFLNRIKATNSKNPNLSQYIKDVSTAIFEFTLAESVSICEYNSNRYETLFTISRHGQEGLDSEKWWNLFNDNESASFSQLVYSQKEKLYFANISQFAYRFGISIIPNADYPVTSDCISALNIAISNIQAQIIIFKQNENLQFLSTTDQLSLLNNRHALQEYLKKESEKIRRYRQRKGAGIQVSIAFIDLDNFKYYNDTFGHSAGDLLITCFARLLKQNCRQIDFIARFGGDEFVIVMSDTSEEETLRVNHRLKENLRTAKYFIPELEKHLETVKLSIPEDKLLNFSMGISTNFDENDFDNLENVMAKADKALYYSKEHRKGEPSVWKDIH